MSGKPLWWEVRGRRLELGRRVLVMGILNVTPDSFSDGGLYFSPEAALARAEQLVQEGADLIDVGGESTRPGAQPVSPGEEAARVVPVVEGIASRWPVPISIDTMKASVARAALRAGAHVVNDVSGLQADPEMARVVAESGAGLVLMHMRGTPATMQQLATYGDVVAEVGQELRQALEGALRAGIREEQVLLDPGIGFAKTASHNYEILRRLGELAVLGRPLLVGPSRKSFIGAVTGRPPAERVFGTAAAVAACVWGGAHIVRVHDVGAMVQVVRVAEAIWR